MIVPTAVAAEMRDLRAPDPVRAFIAKPPAWLVISSLEEAPRADLEKLDLGEREAIELALQRNINLILIDDAQGRRQATAMQLQTLGTLGVLELGAKHRKLDLRDALRKLAYTNIRLSPVLVADALQRNAEFCKAE